MYGKYLVTFSVTKPAVTNLQVCYSRILETFFKILFSGLSSTPYLFSERYGMNVTRRTSNSEGT
jgi:hypothetical protein